jgi:hypothetical protein
VRNSRLIVFGCSVLGFVSRFPPQQEFHGAASMRGGLRPTLRLE